MWPWLPEDPVMVRNKGDARGFGGWSIIDNSLPLHLPFGCKCEIKKHFRSTRAELLWAKNCPQPLKHFSMDFIIGSCFVKPRNHSRFNRISWKYCSMEKKYMVQISFAKENKRNVCQKVFVHFLLHYFWKMSSVLPARPADSLNNWD